MAHQISSQKSTLSETDLIMRVIKKKTFQTAYDYLSKKG